jgi:hypothetical protein
MVKSIKGEAMKKKVIILIALGLLVIAIWCCVLYMFISPTSTERVSVTSVPRYPTATSKPRLQLIHWSCEPDSIGNVVFRGRIKNQGDRDLKFVVLRGKLLRDGKVIGTNTGYIDSDVLYRDATSSFVIYVDDPHGSTTSCDIELERYSFR